MASRLTAHLLAGPSGPQTSVQGAQQGDGGCGGAQTRAHGQREGGGTRFTRPAPAPRSLFRAPYTWHALASALHAPLVVSAARRPTRARPCSTQFPITAIREIKILKILNHKNVVRLKEIVTSKGAHPPLPPLGNYPPHPHTPRAPTNGLGVVSPPRDTRSPDRPPHPPAPPPQVRTTTKARAPFTW